MIDYDLYNERRQQIIEYFGLDPYCFVESLGLTIEDMVDALDWEDNKLLAEEMGWITDEDGQQGSAL